MGKPKLILVGGFLGAGKTTLLWQAARHLVGQGRRVGLITNDQAPQLVDTGFLQEYGFQVGEIAGGCFCCRFQDLVRTADKLIEQMRPDVLIGEPVGSCTDLSATVLQPVKDLYPENYEVLPFSVLIAPNRLREVLKPDGESLLHESARYILQKQLEEADRIVVNKVDTLTEAEREGLAELLAAKYPGTPVSFIAALEGRGVGEWLEAVLAPGQAAGQRIVEVDYDIYAEGEAVLGWLNATAQLSVGEATDWRAYCLALMGALQGRMRARAAEIAHLKILLSTAKGFHIANLTQLGGEPLVQGTIGGEPRGAQLVINARVELAPEELRGIVEEALREVSAGRVGIEELAIQSLSPGRPEPVHRYTRVVSSGVGEEAQS